MKSRNSCSNNCRHESIMMETMSGISVRFIIVRSFHGFFNTLNSPYLCELLINGIYLEGLLFTFIQWNLP